MKKKWIITAILCILLANIIGIIKSPVTSIASSVKENPQLSKKVTICVDRSVRLKVTGTKKNVTWSSSNKKIVKISRKGNIRGIKKGTATITAKIGNKKLSCKVKVTKALPKITELPVIENVALKGIAHYSDNIYCRSSNEKVATVVAVPGEGEDDEEVHFQEATDILIFGHKSGTATITITNNCNKEKVTFKVTVKKPKKATNYQKLVDYILLNGKTDLELGDKILTKKYKSDNGIVRIVYDVWSKRVYYEYKEENGFGKVEWRLMQTEQENREVYMVMWLYPKDSKENYFVTKKIHLDSYEGEDVVFEDAWYRTPALQSLQKISNEVSKRAISHIDKLLQTKIGVQWIDMMPKK